MKVQS